MAEISPSTNRTSTKQTTIGTTTTTTGNTSVKPTQKKQTAKSSASSKSVFEADILSKILQALSDIKQQQLATDVNVYGTCNSRFAFRRDASRYCYEEFMEEEALAEQEFSNASLFQKRDLESSRFSQMTKHLKWLVIVCPAVQEALTLDVFIN
ncbi:hypothetical protein DPMN_142098 [Dreissena polymorpha]|uniref:Uncharacterized protein n=1 Tax=Dreissena polymorpha TaxID=45954 RepID=A0A9D4JLW0_DREPO|nr:hypothetical protein DPMN_142098 [Dreissena polymorpha]